MLKAKQEAEFYKFNSTWRGRGQKLGVNHLCDSFFVVIIVLCVFYTWLFTPDWLAQLVEHRTAVREVAGSNLDRTNTQGL